MTTKAKPKKKAPKAVKAVGHTSVGGGPKSNDHDTPTLAAVQPPPQITEPVRRRYGPTALEPLRRPPDDASPEEWEKYRTARRGRRTFKANRTARIVRRESPHDPQACKVCTARPREATYGQLSPREIAARSLVSRSQVYRVFSDDPKQARGRRTLATLRRIAHDGMGIGLDELAALVLD